MNKPLYNKSKSIKNTYPMIWIQIQIVWRYNRVSLLKHIIISHHTINDEGNLMLNLTPGTVEWGWCIRRYWTLEREYVSTGWQLQLRATTLSIYILVVAVVNFRRWIGFNSLFTVSLSILFGDIFSPTYFCKTAYCNGNCCNKKRITLVSNNSKCILLGWLKICIISH